MISLKELKQHLKVDDDQVDDDALIQGMEAAAVAIIENETGRYFGPVAELVDVVSSVGWGPITLRAVPITDDEYLDFIVERRESQGAGFSTVDADDYEVDGYRLFPLAWWTPAARNLRVTYVAGYEEGEEPADIRQAVRELVTKMYQLRLPIAVGTTVVELPYSVQQIIRANKRIVV